jgi:amino acid permease
MRFKKNIFFIISTLLLRTVSALEINKTVQVQNNIKSISGHVISPTTQAVAYSGGIIIIIAFIFLFIKWEKHKPKKETKIKIKKLSELKKEKNNELKNQENKVEEIKNLLKEEEEKLHKIKNPLIKENITKNQSKLNNEEKIN